MGMVLTFLKKYRAASIAALLMMLIELSVELMQPYLISKIIDNGIRVKDLSVVWLWGGVLLGSSVIAFLAGILSSFFASHASQGFAFDLRDKLYDRVQSFTYSVFSRFESSSLITRLTGDVTQLQDMIFMSLRFATRVPLVVFGSILMALIVDVQLGLLLVLTVPFLIMFVMWMMRIATSNFGKVQSRLDKVNEVIQENLTGIRLIRVFVRTGHEIERFARFSLALMKETVGSLRLMESTVPFVLLLVNCAIIAVLWFGRIEIAAGDASVGQVVAVANYSLRIIGALSALSWVLMNYSRAIASAKRIQEVMDTEDQAEALLHGAVNRPGQPGEQAAPVQGQVEFRNIGFRYPGSDIDVLDGISFKVETGQRVAILGATGSGKSSLIQLIPRLHEPSEGNILIDGVDIRDIPHSRLRASIGYVPQEVVLFTGSVKDNIAWGREEATSSQIETAARQAQIHKTIERLPEGYETKLGQRGVNLSGGQKQRLSIARALVRQPSILILDDSTSALDVSTEAALLEALKNLSCTTFLITQKISSTKSADLILLLDEGRLAALGSHEDLMRTSLLYRKIYQSQYGEGAHHVQSLG
ncbi:ABC transporter ATP-binding protein [Paenibacillus sp. YPG26]|uniref:ABC transporter ATP-binding protein n=1 Tax=Paenibacillus sp. YPG26 TaxID=2878915 RepID=UPI00203D4567|nr:ABC transporter ATP-binding protein [Paenibacillus sp. YPG26]USB33966.1 ABC transporter ATP-binding protein/permease [Paenibacillus sp. YPG26]